jgi:cytochrome c oxidase subunit 2
MQQWIPLMPERASTIAAQVDEFFYFLIAISMFFIVLIAGLEIYFAMRYRRKHEDEVPLPVRGAHSLEAVWILVPFVISMVIFGWGAQLYFQMYRMPADAMDIYVTGKQWMWKIQHMNGRREINSLHVPVGRKVKLTMTSEDVIHDFSVPAFRIKRDVLPGRYSYLGFEATKPGEYHLFCAEYCGTDHAKMGGTVYVMEPADYQAWLGGSTPGTTLAGGGEKLFNQLACNTCHRIGDAGRGPQLEGLWGTNVVLSNGSVVTADEDYLRESILNSQASIVAGYEAPVIMPNFQGQLSEDQVLQLIAYIKSIGPDQEGASAEGSGR